MREAILKRLAAIEREHGVGVVYGCESDSRAWEFASPDSDYDVRFVYARSRNAQNQRTGHGKPIPEIDRFVRTELERHDDAFSGRDRLDRLDKEESRHQINEIFW